MEEIHSRFEMGRVEEQELQIPARSLDRRRRCRIHGWDGQVVKCRQTQSLLTSDSATPSPRILGRMSWTPWGLHKDHFLCTLALRSASADGLLGSGRSHGLSSAWDGGLNPSQRRALPCGRTSPTLAKQGASHGVQGGGTGWR